jgi:hypothetical protein
MVLPGAAVLSRISSSLAASRRAPCLCAGTVLAARATAIVIRGVSLTLGYAPRGSLPLSLNTGLRPHKRAASPDRLSISIWRSALTPLSPLLPSRLPTLRRTAAPP